MSNRAYTKGLHDVGEGVFGYLQPDGSWGWSNAGLIVDGDAALLVDTLFDVRLTREMLESMRRATRAAANIGTVVNTHSDGDHWYGNQLVAGADIIASKAAAEAMWASAPPVELMQQATAMGRWAEFLVQRFSAFDFNDVELTPPTRTFEGELELTVGGKLVRLIQVGPAHTAGDVLVEVVDDRVLFTGDILFIGAHPIVHAGPVAGWIRACDRILTMDVETIVPGHGPITDKGGVAEIKRYWEDLTAEARKRYDAGMPAIEAARDISLDPYASWGEAERLVANVIVLYSEFGGGPHPDVATVFEAMADFATG